MTLRETGRLIRRQIGAAVRLERERRGWSLLQVSRETGGVVPRYAVDRIENGEMRDVATITLVMAALGFELPGCMHTPGNERTAK